VIATDYNRGRGSIYLVFEYIDHDLTGLSDSHGTVRFTEAHIKSFLKQLLEALLFCHSKKILHRDVKGIAIVIVYLIVPKDQICSSVITAP